MAETTTAKAANKSASKVSNRLRQGFAALVWRVNRQLQWFQGAHTEPKPPPKRRCPCLVIARGLYSESWHSYNIRSQRALHKILKQKYGDAANVQFFIGPWHQNQRKVLLIELNNTALSLKEKALTLLPESLVLSAALAPGLYEINDGEHQYYLYKQLYKQESQWQTLLRSGLVNNLEKARLALGCSAEQQATQLTQRQLAALTPRGVAKLGFNYWQQGLQQQQGQRGRQLPWQQLGLTVAGIGAVYLLLSSVYLGVMNQRIDSELEQVTPQVSNLLDQQQQLQQAQQALTELRGEFVNAQRVNAFWEVFAAAAQTENNRITYLQSNDSNLVLGGEIPEALPLLRQLHDLPQVATAEFASPPRNARTGQQYRITMELTGEGQGND
ncbi:hypothetical protein [Pseudidiomarina insulisalsae]|uniref:Uncharacterized protein n=1 Tax=Pseudidiomarina insulisalsae TaxID=575789 RepID=A0A432YNY2_9GAMM|nr:hypothetical protein [Pseudidiomarina insulisalsae]RUO62602.1 hypothetical protein CWI71_03995 [Pseudidiomarina insulisalsae]